MTLEQVSAARCFSGEVLVFQHPSRSTKTPMRFAVFTPPGAARADQPIIYWLSGLTCTEQNFITKAGAFRAAADLGLMIVAPDTSPRGAGVAGEDDSWDLGTGAGFYVDATQQPWAEHYRMYEYVCTELPEIISQHFKNSGVNKAIMGHSMGGHGALVAALRNERTYASVSAFAPICAPSQCPWGTKAFTNYLGSDPSQWLAYDASELVKTTTYNGPILIDQGDRDEFLGGQLLPNRFVDACQQRDLPLEYRLQPGYDHSYYFISTFIEDHLRFHAQNLQPGG